jgi:hypothetical protein
MKASGISNMAKRIIWQASEISALMKRRSLLIAAPIIMASALLMKSSRWHALIMSPSSAPLAPWAAHQRGSISARLYQNNRISAAASRKKMAKHGNNQLTSMKNNQ